MSCCTEPPFQLVLVIQFIKGHLSLGHVRPRWAEILWVKLCLLLEDEDQSRWVGPSPPKGSPSGGLQLERCIMKKKNMYSCQVTITTNSRITLTFACKDEYLLAITCVTITTFVTRLYTVVRFDRMLPN
jgi:hypothetical protein